MKKQRGAAMVEFAIIALLFFMILFGIIEFARAFFTYNTLVEATRRGARVAAVCPADAAGILQVKQVTVFDSTTPDGVTPITGLLGLTTTNNVDVKYLKADGTEVLPSSITGPADTDYDTIAFVRVQIQNVPNINLIIPVVSVSLPVPAIVTTLPSESLGRVNSVNPPIRCCYGVGTCT